MEFANYFNTKAEEHKKQIKNVEDQEHAIENEPYTDKQLKKQYSESQMAELTGGKKTRRRIKNNLVFCNFICYWFLIISFNFTIIVIFFNPSH